MKFRRSTNPATKIIKSFLHWWFRWWKMGWWRAPLWSDAEKRDGVQSSSPVWLSHSGQFRGAPMMRLHGLHSTGSFSRRSSPMGLHSLHWTAKMGRRSSKVQAALSLRRPTPADSIFTDAPSTSVCMQVDPVGAPVPYQQLGHAWTYISHCQDLPMPSPIYCSFGCWLWRHWFHSGTYHFLEKEHATPLIHSA